MLTPKIEDSLSFFKDILGMKEVARKENSVYLRCWVDHEQYSVKLTESPQPGVGQTELRTMSPQALERRLNEIEATGLGISWIDDDVGRGKAYQYRGLDSHLMELYYDTSAYEPREHLRSALKK